jgi:transcription antitermination factor NusG
MSRPTETCGTAGTAPSPGVHGAVGTIEPEPTSETALPQGNGSAVGSTTDVRWWVVHTKPRQEKSLVEDLDQLDIESFLPLQKTVRYYGKRKFRVQLPLFSGYLFLNASHEQAIQADRTGRVAGLIRVADQERIKSELAAIRKALECGATLSVADMLTSGDTVEVTSGPFKGLRGVYDRVGPQGRLLLGVHLINRAAVLEIEHALVQRVD